MLLIVYGTRPEWIKIKPLVKKLDSVGADFKILYTGQHTTIFKEDDRKFDYFLDIDEHNKNRLNNLFGNILLSPKLDDINPEYVLVQGDTATVCAVALKYYNKGVKVIHLEAGLRTYDLENPYPEEAYRQMVSRIASVNLCPTVSNAVNLETEKTSGEAFIVGNTVLDNIAHIKTSYTNKVLFTMHRRENIESIPSWFQVINNIAKNNPTLEFCLPIHPNPAILAHKDLLPNIKVVDALNHHDLIEYLKDCKLVITDSGGIQEEATFLQKKVIVCRKESERMENNGHLHLCKSPEELTEIFNSIVDNYYINEVCPYGDGKATEYIYTILKRLKIV